MLINKEKTKPVFLVEYTPESKEARDLEKRLLIDFNTILEFIKNNFDFTLSNFSIQLSDIKKTVYNETYDIIRSYYQRAFQIGNQYVNTIFGTYDYVTHNDLDFIENRTVDFIARFFGRMENLVLKSNSDFMKALFDIKNLAVRNFEEQTQVDYFSKQIENSSSYLFSSLAILIVTDALNQATMRKTRAMLKLNQRSSAFTGAEFNEGLLSGLEGDPDFGVLQAFKFVFKVTQDERTCPECSALADTTYDVDDISIPIIPDDTHFNCRCRIVLEIP